MNQILADSARPAAVAVDSLSLDLWAPNDSRRTVTTVPIPSPISRPSPSRAPVAKQVESRAHRRARESGPAGLEPTLAHDLNNLLMSIGGHTDLARRKLAKGAPPQEHLEQIGAAVERARQLVSRSSGAARRNGRKPKSQLQTVVREAAELVRASLPANVHLCLRVDDHAPPLRIDHVQIHRLILNLARNAVQAMAESGGELRIALETEDRVVADEPPLPSNRCLRLEVGDEGTGIRPRILQRIFEPRFTTRPGIGRGWGLASVARIAQDHGAVMRIESHVGLGSRFHLFFPLECPAG